MPLLAGDAPWIVAANGSVPRGGLISIATALSKTRLLSRSILWRDKGTDAPWMYSAPAPDRGITRDETLSRVRPRH
jgi:hypothetical protein